MQIFRDQHGPELVELLMAAARSGNVEAIKTGLAYVYGKPKERVEVSGPDDGPIRVDGANLASLTSAELVVLEGMLARLVGDDGSEPTVIPAQ
jgi:hypothetical protein